MAASRTSHVCDVATGKCRDALARARVALPPWEPSAGDYDIAPDGREIAITADLGSEPRMMSQTDIVDRRSCLAPRRAC